MTHVLKSRSKDDAHERIATKSSTSLQNSTGIVIEQFGESATGIYV